jgi:hypothetical protein
VCCAVAGLCSQGRVSPDCLPEPIDSGESGGRALLTGWKKKAYSSLACPPSPSLCFAPGWLRRRCLEQSGAAGTAQRQAQASQASKQERQATRSRAPRLPSGARVGARGSSLERHSIRKFLSFEGVDAENAMVQPDQSMGERHNASMHGLPETRRPQALALR